MTSWIFPNSPTATASHMTPKSAQVVFLKRLRADLIFSLGSRQIDFPQTQTLLLVFQENEFLSSSWTSKFAGIVKGWNANLSWILTFQLNLLLRRRKVQNFAIFCGPPSSFECEIQHVNRVKFPLSYTALLHGLQIGINCKLESLKQV